MSEQDEQGNEQPTGKPWETDPDFLPWLKGQEGFADLFAEAPAEKPKVAKGGGQQVKSTEMEGAMSSLVTALTKGVELGASLGAASAKGSAPEKPAKKAPVLKSHWFFGTYEVDDDGNAND